MDSNLHGALRARVLGGRTGAILGYRVQGSARPSGGFCHPVHLNTDPNCHRRTYSLSRSRYGYPFFG